MSTYYAESNAEGTQALFNKKTIYASRLDAYTSTYGNLTDFFFAEKQLYGKVGRQFIPKTFNNQGRLQLKDFSRIAGGSPPIAGVNFVVDAFNKLAQQFKKCAMAGQINTSDTYLSNLVVYKGFVDPWRQYSRFVTSFEIKLRAYFLARDIVFKDFDEFMVQLEAYWEEAPILFPYTYPAFVKSRFSPMAISGLAVEIADLNPSNDDEKIKAFVESPNWEFYLNACRSYGFLVDKDVPWRLVANIGSPEMLDYAAQYGIYTTGHILGVGYGYAHLKYYNKFKFGLLALYNRTKRENYVERHRCQDGTIINKIITPRNYTSQDFAEKYGEMYFMEKYFKIRFLEEESNFTPEDIHLLVDDAQEIYNVDGLGVALTYLERIINKPYDYRGSLTYIISGEEEDVFSNTG